MKQVKPISQESARGMVEDLLDLEEGLTDWEVNFLEDMSRRKEEYWSLQLKKIDQIYRERT